MQLFQLYSVFFASLLAQVNAAPGLVAEGPSDNETTTAKGPGYVHVPFRKVMMPEEHFKNKQTELPDNLKNDPFVAKAVAYFDEQLNNQRYYYLADVEIGTPPQKQTLLVDTGSSDTWVFTTGTRNSGNGAPFNSAESKTFKSNETNFDIHYGKGSCHGTWGRDTFRIGGATVTDLSIGQALRVSQVNTGLIGIGRPMAESTYTNGGEMYLNLPLKMKEEGIINSAAYSLVLDDVNSSGGMLLFGAVDKDRFTGKLTTLHISHPSHLGVVVQGLYASGVASFNLMSQKKTAVLDSGTSLTYVDTGTLDAYRTAVNSNPSFALGSKYYCDCNVSDSMTIDFGPTKITVPSYNFLWPISMFVSGITATIAFPRNSCYIGIDKAEENFMLFGDNFLRGIYIVYDITDNRIGVAPSKPSSGQPNIQPILPGKPLPFS